MDTIRYKKLWYGGPEAAYGLESAFHRGRTNKICK